MIFIKTIIEIFFKRRQEKLKSELSKDVEKYRHQLQGELSKDIEKYKQQLQRELSKDVEQHKHQLQVKVIRAELEIKQLSIVYPELFLRFKVAEAKICFLCSKNKEQIKSEELGHAKSLIHEAVSFMVKNLLFVSKDVEQMSDDLMVLMHKFEGVMAQSSEEKSLKYKYEVRQLTDKFQLQLRKEIGVDSK